MMTLNELMADWVAIDSDQELSGINLDSRTVQQGEAFIALKGAERYIPQAIAKGAIAVIFDAASHINLADFKNLQNSCHITWIKINNLANKLAEIAARYYRNPCQYLDVIGITGTNGKTSCSQFLAQVLSDSIVIGTLGWGVPGRLQFTGYTTPDTVQLQKIFAESVRLGKKNVVMEVSSHGLQEQRTDQTLFEGAVFTNLSRDHLDYHGSMEAYFHSKLLLFKRPELEFAVINADDPYSARIIDAIAPQVRIWTFTRQNHVVNERCVQAENIQISINGIEFQVVFAAERIQVHSALFGAFNVENMLAVLTTLLALGYSLTDAAAQVSRLKPVPGRMEYFGAHGSPAVFVDYAHTPDALEKALSGLRQHQPQNLSLVFGCGGDRDSGKRPQMAQIAQALADSVIITNDNPRYEDPDKIVADMLSAGCSSKVRVILSRELAIQTAIAEANAGDCILIAGKGHEDYQEIKGIKYPFSDQQIVSQALANRKLAL